LIIVARIGWISKPYNLVTIVGAATISIGVKRIKTQFQLAPGW